jgi:hypothetical protein
LALLTAHKSAVPVDGVPVGIPGRRAEHADRASELVESQHPIVRDVAEQQVAAGGEICRPLRPASPGVQPLDPLVALTAAKPFVDDLELRPDPVNHKRTVS